MGKHRLYILTYLFTEPGYLLFATAFSRTVHDFCPTALLVLSSILLKNSTC